MPPYPADGLSIVPPDPRRLQPEGEITAAWSATSRQADAAGASPWTLAFADRLAQGHPAVGSLLLGSHREGLGSNNWVVDGSLTASGKPLLANDPHLGTNIPSLWYLARLSSGDLDVIGATLPGAPAVAIGRNRHIAWGETNVAADVEDLYLERLNADGTAAMFRGAWEPLRMVSETIRVRGRDPIRFDVRISRHGPIVTDAINMDTSRPALEPLAFRWTALDDDDRTVVAFLRLNEARNWAEFTSALRDFVVPAQNFVYADVDGHIGYYVPGRIPIRAKGDGSRPADGSTGEMEWVGFVPFEELPHLYDPPAHFIVTANHRPASPEYPHLLGLEYPEPYRAARITELLAATGRATPEAFRRIQADTVSNHAKHLLPLLLRSLDPDAPASRRVLELLRSWDFDARDDSAAAAVFQAWFHRLAPALVGDELGSRVLRAYESRFSYVTRFVTSALTGDGARWCDDVRTARTEACRETITNALGEAVARLTPLLGDDPARWRWDAVHRAVFPHQGLDSVRLLRPLISRSVPNGGDWSTINVGPVDVERPFEQRSVAGYRQIIDLSPANDSWFLDAVGQSGHFLSPRYDDFQADWRAVRHRPMRLERARIEQGAIGRLRLIKAD
jgi:penicillin amidase